MPAFRPRHRAKKEPTLRPEEYQEFPSGSTALLRATDELRELSRLEFLVGNNPEGLFLAQLALDLLKIAYGSPLSCTGVWRAFAAQYPRLFTKGALSVTHVCKVDL